ncbi:MAG: hypothetical protein M3Q15_04675 [Pseudomonadota bacterium]|nr:hypothetical protein [Pseudomonadota bacterium]
MKPMRSTMPKWPAYVMMAMAAACAYPAVTGTTPVQERFTALGQEPGWRLTIADGRIDYLGDYGETHINVVRPEPITAFNGHIYQAGRLQVHISHGRCNDVMSGHGYADTVMVVADGKTVNGCGGERRTDWDS